MTPSLTIDRLPRVYVSQRQDDAVDVTDRMLRLVQAHLTGRIRDRIRGRPAGMVPFLTAGAVPPNQIPRSAIRAAVEQCDVILIVIGPEWARSGDGSPRLDDPDDPVRLEAEAAIELNRPVILVPVERARIPDAAELPTDLRRLPYFRPSVVRPWPNFYDDIDRLVDRIVGLLEPLLEPPPPERVAPSYRPSPPRPVPAAARPAPPSPRPAAPSDSAAGHLEPVDCSAYCPPRVGLGETFVIRVIAHHPDQADQADQLALAYDPRARRRADAGLEIDLPRRAILDLHLTSRDLVLANPVQRLVWRGRPSAVAFEAEVPIGCEVRTVVSRVAVTCNGNPVGHLTFQVEVARSKVGVPPDRAGRGLTRYRRAFASYASADRDEVVRRAQMLRLVCDDVFLDVATLRPGQKWAAELERRIDECDLFLLFWSKAARRSKWVRRELQRACARKAGNDSAPPTIYPIPIEGPPPPKPPTELAHLHFNDYYIYLISPRK